MGQGQDEEIEMGSNPKEELAYQYSQHVKPKRKRGAAKVDERLCVQQS